MGYYMERNEELEKTKKYISYFLKDLITLEIYNDKLRKPLLFVYLRKARHELQVYEADHGIQEIAKLGYSIQDRNMYISDFLVEEEFQQNGIGGLLFKIAIAHGNKMGANSLYGYASPTSSIKGVSNNEGTSYDKEQMALIDIYSHLGCEFIKNDDYFKFVKTWNREDVKEFENKEINEFISNIVEKNKQTTEEQIK